MCKYRYQNGLESDDGTLRYFLKWDTEAEDLKLLYSKEKRAFHPNLVRRDRSGSYLTLKDGMCYYHFWGEFYYNIVFTSNSPSPLTTRFEK